MCYNTVISGGLIQIKKLVEKLKNVPVCRTIIRQEDEEIYHCCLFEDTVFQDTGNKLGIEPNTLYLCTARQLKELSLQQLEGITASFLCLQDSSVSEPYFFSNINIVEVSETEKNEYIPAEEKTGDRFGWLWLPALGIPALFFALAYLLFRYRKR